MTELKDIESRSSEPFSGRNFRRRRRGTLYISVMGTAFIVSTVALIAVHQVRVNLKTTQTANQRYKAQLLARSAVEHAVSAFHANPTWETDYLYNVEYPSPAVSVNGGTFSWKLVDVGNGYRRLDGIGRVGPATSVCSVDLAGRNYLQCGLLAGGNLSLGSNETLQVTGAPIATLGTLTNSGTVTGNVEAQTIQNTGTITGTQTPSATPRPLPTPNSIFEYYEANGTPLNVSSLDRDLISPNTAPGGVTNSLGIYVIDANGGSFEIRRSRIVGTLVILNATNGVTIRDQVNWEPAVANYPSVLVQGAINMKFDSAKLSESGQGKNFNPLSTPWQNQTDSSQDDEYPSAIGGIVYCSGSMTFDGNGDTGVVQSFDGLVISAGTCALTAKVTVTVEYDASGANSPPPGFVPGDERTIIPGSWRYRKSN